MISQSHLKMIPSLKTMAATLGKTARAISSEREQEEVRSRSPSPQTSVSTVQDTLRAELMIKSSLL